jgi:hypothetical protein
MPVKGEYASVSPWRFIFRNWLQESAKVDVETQISARIERRVIIYLRRSQSFAHIDLLVAVPSQPLFQRVDLN